jgi:membrane-associated phospholipid phosphatase
MVAEALTRPYRVTAPMVVLVSLVPLYVFIPGLLPTRTLHAPELSLDHLVPLKPNWALVYGALYLFLIVLPVLTVRHEEHIRRTVFAYLLVWISAYVCFLAFPTMAPRPPEVIGQGFGAWGLRALYSADPPYNCFPSLHVAHSFVSALTCYRLHRGVGITSGIAASIIGMSTLYTKQHYVLDVVAGIFLAVVAYALFLRSYPREGISELDRRVAPILALVLGGLVALAVGVSWLVYQSGVA